VSEYENSDDLKTTSKDHGTSENMNFVGFHVHCLYNELQYNNKFNNRQRLKLYAT